MIIGASTCRACRGFLDWTQADLATAAQVSLSTVKNFESGRSLPSPANLRTLQHVFENAEVEFLPSGAVRMRPNPITFGRDYLVNRYKFRLMAYRQNRKIVVDISREALQDAATLSGASLSVRHARFKDQRSEFEHCAKQSIARPSIRYRTRCDRHRYFSRIAPAPRQARRSRPTSPWDKSAVWLRCASRSLVRDLCLHRANFSLLRRIFSLLTSIFPRKMRIFSLQPAIFSLLTTCQIWF